MQEFFNNLTTISFGSISVSTILSAIVVFLICLVCIKAVKAILAKLLGTTKMDPTLKGFILTAANACLWIVAVIVVAQTLGIPTASLVAVVSIAGLALSLSIQNLLANLFSGITLLITKPVAVGELVDIGGKLGTVKSVGLFYTVINTLDNNTISIPNGDVTSASVMNYSREPLRRVDLTFNTSYDSETADVKAAILEAAEADEKILRDPAPFIVIGKYGESTIEYIVRVWCKNPDYWDVYFGMNERVRETFKNHNVSMSYSHVNVHIVDAPKAEKTEE